MQAAGKENIREYLLSYVPWFVGEAGKIAGVKRIALLGSITTEKRESEGYRFPGDS